nr:phosphatidate cytidylyltransferase [uncultured Albidiferax sp.]
MNAFLRALSGSQQVAALFLLVFGVLSLASAALLLVSLRERDDGAFKAAFGSDLTDLRRLLRHTWVMAATFWLGWALGGWFAMGLFGLVAFFALREFITLSPTHRGDHRSLILAFFVVLPVQFWMAGGRHFDLFTVFIPVYVFLALPLVGALADDPHRFLERNAKMQWGIMVCVYGTSHIPALVRLEIPGYADKSAFLVFFLVLVVQSCMLVQHLAARKLKRPPRAPHISQSFNWTSWGLGMAAGGLMGVLLSGITPFKPGQALAMALIACAAGTAGHLVMKALKRDRGITNWGTQGQSITGASGLLDRVDALCFAAPIFFHSVRWFFKL